ncbi:MAG TPA: hypothetical protein VK892_05695 [Pyrinomonadaceae bacterium]|nr:hypothetical protein [Pyrinomonadaceae bacterium]
MITASDESNKLKTVSLEKDTWILEVPAEVCQREGFPTGTLVSLTLKNDAVYGEYIKPSQEVADFVNRIVKEDAEFFEEMKRIGD